MVLQVNSPVVSIDGHETVPPNNEDALLKAAANQPISVAIDAGGSAFQFYSEVYSCHPDSSTICMKNLACRFQTYLHGF